MSVQKPWTKPFMEQRLKEASQEESQRRETRELAGRRNRSPEVVLDSEEESRTASLSLPHRSTPKTYAHRHKKRRHSRSLSPSRSHSRQESPQKVPRIDFKSESHESHRRSPQGRIGENNRRSRSPSRDRPRYNRPPSPGLPQHNGPSSSLKSSFHSIQGIPNTFTESWIGATLPIDLTASDPAKHSSNSHSGQTVSMEALLTRNNELEALLVSDNEHRARLAKELDSKSAQLQASRKEAEELRQRVVALEAKLVSHTANTSFEENLMPSTSAHEFVSKEVQTPPSNLPSHDKCKAQVKRLIANARAELDRRTARAVAAEETAMKYEGRLQEMQDRLNARNHELHGSQIFLSKADDFSTSECTQRLEALNAVIEQASASIADVVSIDKGRPFDEMVSIAEQGIREEYGGFFQASIRANRKNDDPSVMLQLALEHALVSTCFHLLCSWSWIDENTDNLVNIHSQLRCSVDQPIAGRWRSLTRHQTKRVDDEIKLQLVHCVYQHMVKVLVASGYNLGDLDNVQIMCEDRAQSIVQLLVEVDQMLYEGVTSVDLEPFVVPYGDPYDTKYAEDADGSEQQPDQYIAFSTSLGLCSTNAHTNARAVLLRSKVQFQSTINELLEYENALK